MSTKQARLRWLKAVVERGANIRIVDKEKGIEKPSISPLYIPRMRFWRAPDVKITYRALCRSLLRIWNDDSEPKYLNFDDIRKVNRITDAQLTRIERRLLTSAVSGFVFMMVAILTGLYLRTVASFFGSAGALALSAVIWWKYSFLLWQVRLRSLDKDKASIQTFMKGDWYLEIFK